MITSAIIFRIGIDFGYNDVKECSTTNNTETDDKQDGCNQILESKMNILKLNSIYSLNFKNYTEELYKALIKECNYNLLNLSTLNTSLDIESLTSVSNRTMKAIKVLRIDKRVITVNKINKPNNVLIVFCFLGSKNIFDIRIFSNNFCRTEKSWLGGKTRSVQTTN